MKCDGNSTGIFELSYKVGWTDGAILTDET